MQIVTYRESRFSGEKKKQPKNISWSSAEFAQRMVNVKLSWFYKLFHSQLQLSFRSYVPFSWRH